jgi:hypothetical protein
MKENGNAKIVLQCEPVWAQADVIKVLYGMPKPTLVRLACEGKIRSRKLDDRQEECGERTTRVYRCSDVTEWIDREAIDPVKLAAGADTPAKEVA